MAESFDFGLPGLGVRPGDHICALYLGPAERDAAGSVGRVPLCTYLAFFSRVDWMFPPSRLPVTVATTWPPESRTTSENVSRRRPGSP